jgi:hypothetical protein
MTRFLVVVIVVLLSISILAPASQANAWWPDDCQEIEWNSPGDVFDCLTAIFGAMFGGWCGWEPEVNPNV